MTGLVGPERLSLTRDQMRVEPPDVLFTTTEMLNRTLMDGRMRHLVGIDDKRVEDFDDLYTAVDGDIPNRLLPAGRPSDADRDIAALLLE